MVSSIRERMWSVEKEKKRQRILSKEKALEEKKGAVDAIKERIEQKNDKSKHKEIEERKIPTETSGGDSIIESKKEFKKTPKKKGQKKAFKEI
tara:strand:+ start:923 stop:1201 length:279 start_codon:yes stop_codon:yes gene_type:complete